MASYVKNVPFVPVSLVEMVFRKIIGYIATTYIRGHVITIVLSPECLEI